MRMNVGDARDRFSKLIQAVENGEDVTILKHGKPVAQITRSPGTKKRSGPQLGTLAGMGVVVDPDWHKGPETERELEAWLKGRFD